MNTQLGRSVVALATALASLVLMASPASATTHATTITGGTFSATPTGTLTFPTLAFGGAAGAGCGSTVALDVDHVANTATIPTFTSLHHFTWFGSHFVSTMTRTASTAGTIGSGSVSGVGLSLSIAIRNAATNTSSNVDCATTGNVLCTWRVTFAFYGNYTQSGTGSIGSSDTFSLSSPSATVTLAIGTCYVPFTGLNGGSASINGLTGHVTT